MFKTILFGGFYLLNVSQVENKLICIL